MRRAFEDLFFRPVSTKGFGLLRIAWASTVFAFLLMQWADVRVNYSDAGMFPAQLRRAVMATEWRFTILDYVSSPAGVFVLYLVFLGVLVLCACGVLARLTTVASVVLLFSFHERNPLLLSGGDTVLRTIGFILAVAPSVSALSVDRLLKDRRQRSASTTANDEKMPIWPLRLLTWQLIVIYGMSVWAKLLGRSWRNGTAIAIALHHPTYSRVSVTVADMLLPLSPLLTFSTLIFESAWVLLLIPRAIIPQRFDVIPFKRIMIIYGVMFHLSIFALMDVGVFSIAMIASYAGLLVEEDFEAIGLWLNNHKPRRT